MNTRKVIASLLAVCLIGTNATWANGLGLETSKDGIISIHSTHSNNPVTITVSTDKSTYKIGEEVTISGKVSRVVEDEILVALFDSDDTEITVEYFPVNDDGTFQGSISITEEYTPGTYTAEVNYASHIVFLEFSLETKSVQKSAPVTITVSTDKSTYKIGEEVTISGKVSRVVEDEILVALFDSDDTEITVEYFPVNDDGTFIAEMFLAEGNPLGRYTMEIRYASQAVFLEFFVETVSTGTSPKIAINTDLVQYAQDSTVTLSGQVPFIDGKMITVNILYPDNSLYKATEVKPDQDGSFKYSFKLDGKLVAGTYTVKTTYSGSSATTTFVVIESAGLTISTDKTTYFIGNKVKVSGTTHGITGSVLVQVSNPENKLFFKQEVRSNNNGIYTVEFNMEGQLAITGQYVVTATYGKQSAGYSFELKEAIVDTADIPSAVTVSYADKQYNLPYVLSKGRLFDAKLMQGASLLMSIGNSTNASILQITIPRELVDARIAAKDVAFRVMVDSKEVVSRDIKKTSTVRTIEINLPLSAKEVKIIGTESAVQNETDIKLPNKTKTILFLSPVPDTVKAGEQLTFTGVIKTAGRGALQNATISIKTLDALGSEVNLASGVTDSNGRFTIKWSAKPADAGKKFNILAVYDGERNYLKSRSPILSIDIEKPKGANNAATDLFYVVADKESYDLNETVILSGSVREVGRSDTVGIFVFDPKQRYFLVAEAPIQPDKSFSYPFWLPEDHVIPGLYTVSVEYLHKVVTTSFYVGGIRQSEIVQATLKLNQPPPVITRGDVVVFTGFLKEQSRQTGISNATVWIKQKQSDGQDVGLAFGKTDAKGMFTIKWITDNIGDAEGIKVYAYLERPGYNTTKSEDFPINIRDRLYTMSVNTDKTQYSIGETVRVQGKVSEVMDGVPVAIQIFNPHELSFKFDTIQVNADGNFQYEFKLKGVAIIKGTYTIKVSYLENIVVKEIDVNNDIAEPISVKRISLEDPIGLPIRTVGVGEEVFIKSIVRNNLDFEEQFTYIVQIKDSNGSTVLLDWVTKRALVKEEIHSEISWVPESSGDYDVQVFVWEDLENPIPLSNPTSLTYTISVA